MLLAVLLFITFLLCAVSAMPTRWFTGAAIGLKTAYMRRAERSLDRELARQAAAQPFTPGQSFLPRGVGLALDAERQLLFVAARQGGRLESAILPFAAVRGVSHGEARDNGFYDFYVDLAVADAAKPVWHLMCGENPALAGEVRHALAMVRH